MRTRQDLETYLLDSPYACDEVADGTWLVRDPGQPGENIVVRVEDDLVVYRLKVLSLERVSDRTGLFECLLRLNASDIAHGAYALADGHLVLTAVHQLGTLDEEELRATVDDFVLAVQNHHSTLQRFCA